MGGFFWVMFLILQFQGSCPFFWEGFHACPRVEGMIEKTVARSVFDARSHLP